MKKSIILATLLALGSTSLSADICSDGFKMDFTFFGGRTKGYVVDDNTFTKMTATFPKAKLEGATVDIDLFSISTPDKTNGVMTWEDGMIKVRDKNTADAFFKIHEKDPGKGSAKIVKVSDNSVDVAVSINGETQTMTMKTKVDGDKLKATGELDVSKFGSKAWNNFRTLCAGFHQRKSWAIINVNFEVPASCK